MSVIPGFLTLAVFLLLTFSSTVSCVFLSTYVYLRSLYIFCSMASLRIPESSNWTFVACRFGAYAGRRRITESLGNNIRFHLHCGKFTIYDVRMALTLHYPVVPQLVISKNSNKRFITIYMISITPWWFKWTPQKLRKHILLLQEKGCRLAFHNLSLKRITREYRKNPKGIFKAAG